MVFPSFSIEKDLDETSIVIFFAQYFMALSIRIVTISSKSTLFSFMGFFVSGLKEVFKTIFF